MTTDRDVRALLALLSILACVGGAGSCLACLCEARALQAAGLDARWWNVSAVACFLVLFVGAMLAVLASQGTRGRRA